MIEMFSLPVNDNVILKLPDLSEASSLYSVLDKNRTFLRQYLCWVDQNTSIKDSEAFIQMGIHKYKEGSGFCLCVYYQGSIVGTISLHYIDKLNKRTEIGYWLAKDFNGKGIMRESCKALINFAFMRLNLHRVEIRCAVNNIASRRIPEGLGFTQEAILRETEYIDNKFLDTVVYGLLSTDSLEELRPT